MSPSEEVNEAEGRGPARCGMPNCKVPSDLLRHDPLTDTYWCRGHDPDPTVAAQRKADQERGGMSTARRFKRGLDASELGELATPADAERWSRLVAVAVASGVLTPAQGNTTLRAVSEFVKSRDLRVREDRLSALESELQRLRTMRRVQ